MDPKRRHRPGSGAHASGSRGAPPPRSAVARGTGNAQAEDAGTANAGCQGPLPDAVAPVPVHSAQASHTGDSIATAPYTITNSGIITTIVQAPREVALQLRKRALLIGTALAVLTVLASTTSAGGPEGSPRASMATPTGDSGVSASPSDPGASASPSGSATPTPTDRTTTGPEPSADEATSPSGLPAPSRTPGTSPLAARPPEAGKTLPADCTKETGPSHPVWPVQYGDTHWGLSESAEAHKLQEDGKLLGGFNMMRANRTNLTYYWATGWADVDPGDTEIWLVLNWTDGTTASSCGRRLDRTGYWHDTIAVPRYINGKYITYRACQGIYGRPATCTDWK